MECMMVAERLLTCSVNASETAGCNETKLQTCENNNSYKFMLMKIELKQICPCLHELRALVAAQQHGVCTKHSGEAFHHEATMWLDGIRRLQFHLVKNLQGQIKFRRGSILWIQTRNHNPLDSWNAAVCLQPATRTS